MKAKLMSIEDWLDEKFYEKLFFQKKKSNWIMAKNENFSDCKKMKNIFLVGLQWRRAIFDTERIKCDYGILISTDYKNLIYLAEDKMSLAVNFDTQRM